MIGPIKIQSIDELEAAKGELLQDVMVELPLRVVEELRDKANRKDPSPTPNPKPRRDRADSRSQRPSRNPTVEEVQAEIARQQQRGVPTANLPESVQRALSRDRLLISRGEIRELLQAPPPAVETAEPPPAGLPDGTLIKCLGCGHFFAEQSLMKSGLCKWCEEKQAAAETDGAEQLIDRGQVIACVCGKEFYENDPDSDGKVCPKCYKAMISVVGNNGQVTAPNQTTDPVKPEHRAAAAVMDEVLAGDKPEAEPAEQTTRERVDAQIKALQVDRRLTVSVRDCMRFVNMKSELMADAEVKKALRVDATEFAGLTNTLNHFATTLRLLESGDDRKYLCDCLKLQLIACGVSE